MKVVILNSHIHGSVSGEETFWSMLAAAIPGSEAVALSEFSGDITAYLADVRPDIIITNSILGDISTPAGVKKIVLLQDNFVAMERLVPKPWKLKLYYLVRGNSQIRMIALQRQAIASADIIVAVSQSVASSYGVQARITPIGVDSELFRPMGMKAEYRKKYGLPADKKISIFVGSTHAVKGYDLLKRVVASNPEIFYIVVLKDNTLPATPYPNMKFFQKIPQDTLAELYNAADEYVGMSRVETLWLAPIEAMFCGVPVDVAPVGIFDDWKPANKNPREDAFEKGLDRRTMIKRWTELIRSLHSPTSVSPTTDV